MSTTTTATTTAKVSSKGSLTAKSGFKAEEIFRTDANIKIKLEQYFNKNIVTIKKVHGEKYDSILVFEDNSELKIQNKKILGVGGRGDSFDRRKLEHTFENEELRNNMTLLALNRIDKRKTQMTAEQKIEYIKLCENNLTDIKQYLKKTLIGIDSRNNDYFCIMKTDATFAEMEIYMINSNKLYEFIENSIRIHISLKNNGTCLQLTPDIYLQRKGGGLTDHSPDDIQAKFKITQEILELCDKIL